MGQTSVKDAKKTTETTSLPSTGSGAGTTRATALCASTTVALQHRQPQVLNKNALFLSWTNCHTSVLNTPHPRYVVRTLHYCRRVSSSQTWSMGDSAYQGSRGIQSTPVDDEAAIESRWPPLNQLYTGQLCYSRVAMNDNTMQVSESTTDSYVSNLPLFPLLLGGVVGYCI